MRRLLSSSKVHPLSSSTPFCHSERLREFTVTVILEIFYQESRPNFYKYNEKRRSLHTKIQEYHLGRTGECSSLRAKAGIQELQLPPVILMIHFCIRFARISVFKNIEGFSFYNTLTKTILTNETVKYEIYVFLIQKTRLKRMTIIILMIK